jgi:hypothetical protein
MKICQKICQATKKFIKANQCRNFQRFQHKKREVKTLMISNEPKKGRSLVMVPVIKNFKPKLAFNSGQKG